MDWKTLLNRERPRKSTSSGDHREEFERDFDRSIFSNPVKRLQDKAQVFPLEPCDAVRTRLTHSLEVSSVARGLATKAGKWLVAEKEIEQGTERQIEAIAATAALIHDLGNPPFGHAGEAAIREWFINHAASVAMARPDEKQAHDFLSREFGGDEQCVFDFLRFEGNAQTLRLVTKLQILADFNGLNLTFGTLSAATKYTAASHKVAASGDKAMKKPGFFASENDIVGRVRDATGTGNARNPITYLVEASDDIVYSVADVEDGVKKGVISWSEIEGRLKESGDDVQPSLEESLTRKNSILKAGRESVPSHLSDDIHASAFRTAVIGVAVGEAFEMFKKAYGAIMSGTYQSDLISDCAAAPLINALKGIGAQRIYCTPSTLKLEIMGRRIIADLMTLFWEGAEKLPTDKEPKTKDFPGRIGALLSKNYREVFRCMSTDRDLPDPYRRYQLVTDYVCGMTDSFARTLHRELFNAA